MTIRLYINSTIFLLSTIFVLSCSKKTPVLPQPDTTFTVSVSTIAGIAGVAGDANGSLKDAKLNNPLFITTDYEGNIYLADHQRIRKIDKAGFINDYVGTDYGYLDGSVSVAKFRDVSRMIADANGNLYVVDRYSIRKVTPARTVSTLAGGESSGSRDGLGQQVLFNTILAIKIDGNGELYVIDGKPEVNYLQIRKIASNGTVTTLAHIAPFSFTDLIFDKQNNMYISSPFAVYKVNTTGQLEEFVGGKIGRTNGKGADAKFDGIYGLAIDSKGMIYAQDRGNNCIRKITPVGNVTTLAGTAAHGYLDGPAATAKFNVPYSISIDKEDNLYIADSNNHVIRKIVLYKNQ